MSASSKFTLVYECNPVNISTIKKGLDGAWIRWGLYNSFENIVLRELAVSDTPGKTLLKVPKNSYGWGSIEP